MPTLRDSAAREAVLERVGTEPAAGVHHLRQFGV